MMIKIEYYILAIQLLLYVSMTGCDLNASYKLRPDRNSLQNLEPCSFYGALGKPSSAAVTCAGECSNRVRCLNHQYVVQERLCILCIASTSSIDLTKLVPIGNTTTASADLWEKEESSLCTTDTHGEMFTQNGLDSRWKFTALEWPVLGFNVRHYNITFDFRTTATDGLLFFAENKPSSDVATKHDFIAGSIKDGHIVHSMITHASYSTAKATSSVKYNDGLYHTVVFNKTGDFIKLCIDGGPCKEGVSSRGGTTGTSELNGVVYMGDVPDSLSSKAKSRLGVSSIVGYQGCIKNLIVDGINSPQPTEKINTRISCYC